VNIDSTRDESGQRDPAGLSVGFFQPEDAEGVAELFTSVYGDGYPAKIVYHPEQLIAAYKNRDNIPIVVRTPENRVVGYSSLFRVAPNRGVYEKGNGAVAKDFRNAGVMGMIFRYVRGILPELNNIDVFFGEPVCNHIYIQKAALANLPFVETALEVDLMPAQAYEKERSASGRVSTLLMFITIASKPHAVFLPNVYADCMRYIYEGLDDKRSFAVSTAKCSSLRQTRIDTQVFDSAHVARLTVHYAGSDFQKIFLAEERRLRSRDLRVIQVYLKLSWPWITRIVTQLRKNSYFFGGLLPQWFGEDGFLMQKILSRPNWEGIQLFSERANRILEFVNADWRKTANLRELNCY